MHNPDNTVCDTSKHKMIIGLKANLVITVAMMMMMSNIAEVNTRATHGYVGDGTRQCTKSRTPLKSMLHFLIQFVCAK